MIACYSRDKEETSCAVIVHVCHLRASACSVVTLCKDSKWYRDYRVIIMGNIDFWQFMHYLSAIFPYLLFSYRLCLGACHRVKAIDIKYRISNIY